MTFKLDESPESIVVLLKYWDGALEVGRTFVKVTCDCIIQNGGCTDDWTAICLAGDNSSDTNDVVQILAAPGGWGMRLLWGKWRTLQGQ